MMKLRDIVLTSAVVLSACKGEIAIPVAGANQQTREVYLTAPVERMQSNRDAAADLVFVWKDAKTGDEGCAYKSIESSGATQARLVNYSAAKEAAQLNSTISLRYTIGMTSQGHTPDGCVIVTGFEIHKPE